MLLFHEARGAPRALPLPPRGAPAEAEGAAAGAGAGATAPEEAASPAASLFFFFAAFPEVLKAERVTPN